VIPAIALALGALLPGVAAAQDADPAQVHANFYKKHAPAIVGVKQSGNRASGTGVIIDERGYIVTSSLAIAGERSVTVYLHGGGTASASVVARADDKELAILKLGGEGKSWPAVELGRSADVKIGRVCYVLGDSFESIFTDGQAAISVGVISGRYTLEKRKRQSYAGEVLETSAAVNQNQGGGPLLDAHGRVLGLVSMNYHDSKFAGVAIPIDALREAIEAAIEGRAMPRAVAKQASGWIGAEFEEHEGQVFAVRVFSNGPAKEAGLERGEVVVSITAGSDTVPVRQLKDLTDRIDRLTPGDTVILKVYREDTDAERDVTIVAGERKIY
jgi:serine protease Do